MRTFLCWAILLATLPLGAQAPVITPKGDPSVRNDTIYKLAVTPADYPEDQVVYLLDDGVTRLDTDGSGTRTFRQVVQVLKEDAVDEMSERSFSYSPGHERITLNWVRVLKPDGTVVSDGPSHVQDADVPAEMGNPVYADVKVKRISLSGVQAGTLIDISVTREEFKPYRPGDFLEFWKMHMFSPVLRSRYLLDLPRSVTPRIEERNLLAPRVTRTVGDRTIYLWTAQNVPKITYEPFASDSNGVVAQVAVGAPTTWAGVAQWYATYARGRYTASPALKRQIRELVTGARTLNDSIENVQRWITRDVRYVSLALGQGGYQPRMPDSVFATKFGDCKDKATLFVTAMGELGVTAYPVLLNSGGHVRPMLPSYHQFNHVIAAVKRPSGYIYADLTNPLRGYGEALSEFDGEFGLIVFPDGKSEEITFPRGAVINNADSTVIAGTLDTAGTFRGRYEEYGRGIFALAMRKLFEAPLDSAQRLHFVNAVARRYFQDAAGDSLVAFDGKDFSAPPVIRVAITRAQAASVSGGTTILTLPPGNGTGALQMVERLTEEPKRRFPIDASRVFGRQMITTEMRITLPAGWRAKLPASVNATSVFGSYVTEYAQQGRTLRITRRITGAQGIYPPERVGELTDWFRAMAKDDAKFVVLETAGK